MPPATPLHVFVTGSASGIGRRLSDVLIDRGHRVSATDVAIDALRAHASARAWPADRTLPLALDVREWAAWERAYAAAEAHLGPIDVHVNVAGYLKPGWIDRIAIDELDRHIDVNLRGAAYGTVIAARHMAPRGRGHIVNVASLAGVAPIPGIAIYSATKHAVRGLSIAAAAELAERGVAVTTICPDAVQTPMLDLQIDHDEAALTFSGSRALTVDEVVLAIVDRVLRRRPIEVAMPRGRALLARLAGLFPRLAVAVRPRLQARGRARQAAIRDPRPG